MSFAMQNYYKYFNVASDISIFLTKVHLFLKYYMFFAILSLRNIEGAIPKIQKRSDDLWFISRFRSNYASLLAPKCLINRAKCTFFEFSCENIWSCQKKVVPLHAFSQYALPHTYVCEIKTRRKAARRKALRNIYKQI